MIGFLMLVQAVFLIKRHRFRGTGITEYLVAIARITPP